MAKQIVKLTVNGRAVEALVEPRTLLIHFLREELGLKGAAHRLRHQPLRRLHRRSGRPLGEVLHHVRRAGRRRRDRHRRGTGPGRQLHPLQAAFREHHGLQCGFCTPGMLMRGYRLLQENPNPTEDEVRWGLSGNICRCTGYQNIVKAVQHAAAEDARRQGGRRMSAVTAADPRAARGDAARHRLQPQRKEDARLIQGKGNYVDDVTPAGHAARRLRPQPLWPCADQEHRREQGQGAAGRACRADRQRPEAVEPALHADAGRRRAGGAGGQEGAVPEPGGRLRHRRRPLHRGRRAST